ncbi:trypsin-like peptidase domain-containing protein [Nonomuraea angiospora]|uniref:S1C family serine protease n=1 Tax=Nonomuraea angiospora TaxID=46172 RepID=UPI0034335267
MVLEAAMRGLGSPRGPEFVTPPAAATVPRDMPQDGSRKSPQDAPQRTPQDLPRRTPQDVPRKAPLKGRLLGAAALVAALTGSVAGVAGARLSEGPVPAAALPRVAPAPSAGLSGLSATAARVLPSVVSVETGSGSGSGFVVDGSGHILTNAHVIRGGDRATVVLNDGRRISARVIGEDDDEDLAVLEVDYPRELTPATLGRSGDLAVGDQVLAIGSPLGLSGTVTAGIVSALDREVRLGSARRTAVQTDASINPGNSGGPLVNARGEVVGVNTAIASGRGGGNIGIGFAIPIDRAAPIAERIIRN